MLTVVLALLAAVAFGASVAMQQRAASAVPQTLALRPGLLVRLARSPVWLAGVACSIAGFVLQTAALGNGSLVVAQPVMATSLVFALGFVALATRTGLHRTEWWGVGAVVVGLAAFLSLVAPGGENAAEASPRAWWAYAAVTGAAVAACAAMSTVVSGRRRALLLGLAAGLGNGVVAVLTKAFSQSLANGPVHAAGSWPLWALLAAGVPAVILVQTVYQSGHLSASLPVIAVLEPLVAVLSSVILFSEDLGLHGRGLPALVGSAVLAGGGLCLLASRSRLLEPYVSLERQPAPPSRFFTPIGAASTPESDA